jgi:ADP-heptose:LPS heptosyltransferase
VTDATQVSNIAAHIPFMSLPRVFGTTPATIPADPRYLIAPNPSAAMTLPARGRRRIGLVWAGSPDNRMDKERSMPAMMLAPLCDATDADFVSLQIGPGAAEVADLPADRIAFVCDGKVGDFADTAAVLDQLDLVIGVDTAVIHLAGALGKPAWLLLPSAPDYRWLAEGATTGWYPSIRLFRQAKRGDWASVIEDAAKVLTAW